MHWKRHRTYTPGLLVHKSEVLEANERTEQIFQRKLRLQMELMRYKNMMRRILITKDTSYFSPGAISWETINKKNVGFIF